MSPTGHLAALGPGVDDPAGAIHGGKRRATPAEWHSEGCWILGTCGRHPWRTRYWRLFDSRREAPTHPSRNVKPRVSRNACQVAPWYDRGACRTWRQRGTELGQAVLAWRATDGFSESYRAFAGGIAVCQWQPARPGLGGHKPGPDLQHGASEFVEVIVGVGQWYAWLLSSKPGPDRHCMARCA